MEQTGKHDVNVSGVPQRSVLSQQLFKLYSAELFSTLEKKHCGYAYDSTLKDVVPSHGERVAVIESLNLDLHSLWEMKLNASDTKTMIVLRSRTIHPQADTLSPDGTLAKESAHLFILGVTFDTKMTFQKHLRSVSRSAVQRLGIMKKVWQAYNDRSLPLRPFWCFVLPVLEYCSTVWCSADDSYQLPDRVVRSASFLAVCVLECNLVHRRSVAVLCMLFKIKAPQCVL